MIQEYNDVQTDNRGTQVFETKLFPITILLYRRVYCWCCPEDRAVLRTAVVVYAGQEPG